MLTISRKPLSRHHVQTGSGIHPHKVSGLFSGSTVVGVESKPLTLPDSEVKIRSIPPQAQVSSLSTGNILSFTFASFL
jgi:hypothetical protein